MMCICMLVCCACVRICMYVRGREKVGGREGGRRIRERFIENIIGTIITHRVLRYTLLIQ